MVQMFSLLMFSNDMNLYNSKYNITPHVDRLPTDKCDFADVYCQLCKRMMSDNMTTRQIKCIE